MNFSDLDPKFSPFCFLEPTVSETPNGILVGSAVFAYTAAKANGF